jgi:hypothetical protein
MWMPSTCFTDPEVEIRGRWKGHKNGRIVNRNISVEQLTTDARVVGLPCVGCPVKYSEKHGSPVTIDFLLEIVAPHIAAYYPEEHIKIAEVLAEPSNVQGMAQRKPKVVGEPVFLRSCYALPENMQQCEVLQSQEESLLSHKPCFSEYFTGPPTQRSPATRAPVVSCSTDMYRFTIRPFL